MLGVVAIIGLGIGLFLAYRQWYVATHPVEVAFNKLHRIVRNGDSVADLEVNLGAGEALAGNNVPQYVIGYAQSLPDGLEDGDRFYRWTIRNHRLHFQFRDGRLVNHDPKIFADIDSHFVGVGK